MEEHLDALVEELCADDILAESDEFTQEMISEVLSIETRTKMSRKMGREEVLLTRKKDRAMKTTATTSVLMNRARRLAEIMLKRRMFKKNPDDMSRQEKERFEMGAGKRKALVARLAQRLVSKVRQLQNTRIHHQQHSVSHTHDVAAKNIAQAGAD